MICLGILGALLVNVALPMEAWRNMFMVAVAPAIILFLGELPSPALLAMTCFIGNSSMLLQLLAR